MDPRERLLEAAISCLQEHGYAQTTTRRIVAAAGLHLPAVNYYFGSKERLLHDAVVEALRRWGQTTMTAPHVTDAPPAQRLGRSLDRFLSTLAEDRAYVVAAAEAFAQAERSDELRARLADAYGEFRGVVAAGLQPPAEDGDAPSDEVSALASTLIALFDGLAIQWLINPDAAISAEQVLASLATIGRMTSLSDAY